MERADPMAKNTRSTVLAYLFIILMTGVASSVFAQTTSYNIPAGFGTLTYDETISSGGTCPIGSRTRTQEPISEYLFNIFVYNGQSLSGSIEYIALPDGSYCPPTGYPSTCPLPAVITRWNHILFFTPPSYPPGGSSGASATWTQSQVWTAPMSSAYGCSVAVNKATPTIAESVQGQ
jgi:hypothetical protein